MGCYWAMFREVKGNLCRFDTRVYLRSIKQPEDDDICIGAVVGKNPGSAMPTDADIRILQEINLNKDQLLPNVRSIFEKGFLLAKQDIPINAYIQVLNLMYICDSDLNCAIKKIKKIGPIICDTETNNYNFIWYVWGSKNKNLDIYKSRFKLLNTHTHFYYDEKNKKIVNAAPGPADQARHTQGLKHDYVVPYISQILKNTVKVNTPNVG